MDVFDIMLTSDFSQIFKTIGMEESSGYSSILQQKLVTRTGEPAPEGLILGTPAEEHFKNLLLTNVNAGSTDMMVISVGSDRFNETLERDDADSTCTGPFPIVGTPEEILQARR